MKATWLIPVLAFPVLAQPQVKTGMKLGDFSLHDPFVLAHKESRTYYLYNSAGGNITGGKGAGVMAYKSKDLDAWEGPYLVFVVPPGMWANPAHGAWAPEVHEYKGKFYLFVTLHNRDRLIPSAPPPELRPIYQKVNAPHHLRATQIAVAGSPDGPFQVHGPKMQTPEDYMTLDGTLFVEDGTPWMVYAHEWIQMLDGTIEAVPLKPDLSEAAGPPIFLFKASDAPWLADQQKAAVRQRTYVTDGPQFYRTKTGKLLMIWSSYRDGLYVETLAHSASGTLKGPWTQGDVLVGEDSGHGMIFTSFDNRLMLILHQPFNRAKGKLFELEDTGDTVRIKRQIVW
ncbi:MAG: glycoside hydrolase family 43 protein [Bryobacteraceae bacterium]